MGATRLYSTASVEEQWRGVTGPWLRGRAANAWLEPRPTVVLTPSRIEGFYLRDRLLKENVSLLGFHFWTPSDARKFLLAQASPGSGPIAATQADLGLLARNAADRLRRDQPAGPDAEPGTLQSVASDPGPFLRAYDLLLGAGWSPARVGAVYGRELALEFECDLARHALATQAGVHRHLRRTASDRNEPPIADLLVAGFNAAHWPLWDLLHAVVASASMATVALIAPYHYFARDVDGLWIGSWEQVIGGEAVTPEYAADENAVDSFSTLIESYKNGEAGKVAAGADLTFLATPDLASQARALVLQAVEYLKRDECTRLGIIFASANALALEVAEQLRQLGVPLNDGTGALRPGPFEQRAWQAWVAVQEEPSVQRLIAWLRACEAQGKETGLDPLVTARDAAAVLDSALGDSLVDDPDFLASHLAENDPRARESAVADFLQKRIVLPAESTFAGFIVATGRALRGRGWEDHRARLEMEPSPWLSGENRPISRRTFLAWLRESTRSQERVRCEEGNHFYGRVHHLVYAQMTGQTWSHLILTGLNEGVWPRIFEAEAFGSRHELAALNARARGLNEAGTVQGAQGEGHQTVAAGHAYCLLPGDRFDFALRDLCSALASTRHAVCLTAMTTEAGRGLLPSDFVSHAYQAATGQTLDEPTFRQLALTTLAWVRRHDSLVLPATSAATPIEATRIAYEARRDESQPFGPFEFAYETPPVPPIQLSCKDWEDAWHHPAPAWLSNVVGVTEWPEGRLVWPRAVGTWVHRWLSAALRDNGQFSAENFLLRLRATAEEGSTRMHARARATGVTLYPWWDHVHAQARGIALGLGQSLAPELTPGRYLSEYRLPRDLMVALPFATQADFLLRGRLDLVLIEPAGEMPGTDDFSGSSCWVIDFKTGVASKLNLEKIAKGTGLQIVLYALALSARGAESVAITLHTSDAKLKKQVDLDILKQPAASLFRSLDLFHRAGVFGMRSDGQNEHGYAPGYPMATRFIDGEILAAKWELLHGDPQDEEESE